MNAHAPIAASQPAAQLEDLLNLVVLIRDELAAAGIGPFSDIPELTRAYSLARIAADLASRPEYRVAAGLSQEVVAAKMGVDRAYISGLETGRRNPTVVTLWHAALAIEVDISQLLESNSDRLKE